MSKHRKGGVKGESWSKSGRAPEKANRAVEGRHMPSLDRPTRDTPSIDDMAREAGNPDLVGRAAQDVPGTSIKKGDPIYPADLRTVGQGLARTPAIREILGRYTPEQRRSALTAIAQRVGSDHLARQILESYTADWQSHGTDNFGAKNTGKFLGRVVDDSATVRRIVGPEKPEEVRKLAVQFYLGLLTACVNPEQTKIYLRAVCNNVHAEWPECIEVQSIIENSVHASEEDFGQWLVEEGKPRRNPTPKEREEMRGLLNRYMATMFFTHLREAKIFQFKDRDYLRLYHLADVYTTTAAGYRWKPNFAGLARRAELEKVGKLTCVEGAQLAFPEKLPFSSVYLAWGNGAESPMVQRVLYGLAQDGKGYVVDDGRLHLIMGTLLSDDGWAWTIAFSTSIQKQDIGNVWTDGHGTPIIILERVGEVTDDYSKPEEKIHAGEHRRMLNPGWTLPYALTPWIVNNAIAAIQANDTVRKLMPGLLSEKLKINTINKRTGTKFLPPPYYAVIIKPNTYTEIEKKVISQAREWSHRWDVIGHYAHRIMEGDVPIDPKLYAQLTKRGYEFFHSLHKPSGDALAFFMRQRIYLREGRWLAYLKFYRKAYVKGPENKPYVPSVHRLKGGVPEVV